MARIVEITIPENRLKNGIAILREVDQPFLPGNKPLFGMRVIQKKETFNFHFRKSVDSREMVMGKLEGNPRLFLAPKGQVYANHFLQTDLRKVHRSEIVAALRNLGYIGTVPCDVITFPLFFGAATGMIPL